MLRASEYAEAAHDQLKLGGDNEQAMVYAVLAQASALDDMARAIDNLWTDLREGNVLIKHENIGDTDE